MNLCNSKILAIFLAMAGASFPVHARVNPEYIEHQAAKRYAKSGREVAIYAYPLVLMGNLKHYATYTSSPGELKAPINQFSHSKAQSTPLDLFAYPSVDVLTSNAWLDLSNGPIVFHVPDVYKRFFMFEIFDGWTNVLATIDPSTNNSKAKDFVICGPGFKGQVNNNFTQLRSSTNMIYVKGFTQCFGPNDYEAIYKIQDGYTLTPLAYFGKNWSPPAYVAVKGSIASKESAADQVDEMQSNEYFNRFAILLKKNPPGTLDIAIAKDLEELGITPDNNFDTEDTRSYVEEGLKMALESCKDKIENCYKKVYSTRNYWELILRRESDFGSDYIRRALLASQELPASLSQNILTLSSERDSDGNRFNGLHKYILHLCKDEIPPVKAFWSLTVYNEFNNLSYNPINRYSIQSFADSLIFNEDGSCDIHIQRKPPKSKNINWLPCPKGAFNLLFRLYQPTTAVLDGAWAPPDPCCQDPITF